MILWIDAQLSPKLAPWLTDTFEEMEAFSVRFLGLRDAKDREIFMAARQVGAIVITKDKDFVNLLEQYGTPPKLIWVTCGNTSNSRMREILTAQLPQALALLAESETLVEIRDRVDS